MKSKISCWRLVRSLPRSMVSASSGRVSGGAVESYEHVFGTVARPLDGLNREAPQGYTRRRPRADGGIGRRARLRAWSGITGWRFESSSAHSEKPRSAGLFAFSGSTAAVGANFRGNALWQLGGALRPQTWPQAEEPRWASTTT